MFTDKKFPSSYTTNGPTPKKNNAFRLAATSVIFKKSDVEPNDCSIYYQCLKKRVACCFHDCIRAKLKNSRVITSVNTSATRMFQIQGVPQ